MQIAKFLCTLRLVWRVLKFDVWLSNFSRIAMLYIAVV